MAPPTAAASASVLLFTAPAIRATRGGGHPIPSAPSATSSCHPVILSKQAPVRSILSLPKCPVARERNPTMPHHIDRAAKYCRNVLINRNPGRANVPVSHPILSFPLVRPPRTLTLFPVPPHHPVPPVILSKPLPSMHPKCPVARERHEPYQASRHRSRG